MLAADVKNGKFKKYLETYAQEIKKDWPMLMKIEWGMDLNSSHEKYIAEQVYKKP